MSPSPPRERAGEGLFPLCRKKFDFGSQYGEFWCILDGVFFYSSAVLQAKPEFNRYRRMKAVMVTGEYRPR